MKLAENSNANEYSELEQKVETLNLIYIYHTYNDLYAGFANNINTYNK